MSNCNHANAGFGYCHQCGAILDGSDEEEERIRNLEKENEEMKQLQKKFERVRNLVETISSWDERDKDGPTVQERYLAKEILRILDEESK